MVMTEDNLYFLASKKKIDFLKQVNRALLIPISRTTEGKSFYYGPFFSDRIGRGQGHGCQHQAPCARQGGQRQKELWHPQRRHQVVPGRQEPRCRRQRPRKVPRTFHDCFQVCVPHFLEDF